MLSDFPLELYQKTDLDGTHWYYHIEATCLTPGAMSAIVTKAEEVGYYVWSLEVTPWKWIGPDAKEPWKPGVHLFSITMFEAGNQSGTIATVVVAPKVKTVIELSPRTMHKMLTVSRRRTGVRYSGLGDKM